MADFIGYKNKLTFEHVLDGVVVNIHKLDENTFLWVQYSQKGLDSGLNILTATYNLERVRKMVEHLTPYTKDITALDLFEKFILNT
jgi:hypothetical protein